MHHGDSFFIILFLLQFKWTKYYYYYGIAESREMVGRERGGRKRDAITAIMA
jgi:hypothetical protein